MNCRTCEHRHFERTLRTLARPPSMSGSGSVYLLRVVVVVDDGDSALGSRGGPRGRRVSPSCANRPSGGRPQRSGARGATPQVSRPGVVPARNRLSASRRAARRERRRPPPPLSLRLRRPRPVRPESRQGDPPNLSILISGGKENNRDALSNGE